MRGFSQKAINVRGCHNGNLYVKSILAWSEYFGITEYRMKQLYAAGLRGQDLVNAAAKLAPNNADIAAVRNQYLYGRA